MVYSAIDPRSAARDFRLQQGDAFVQLIDGKWIEILPGQHRQGIAGRSGQDVV